jgi:4-amino-4-deoxy-L-arabinose transferase-like glycosyltransferase
MVCFLFMVISMLLFMEVLVFHSEQPLHIYGAWLTLGLATFTKGPLVLLFPARERQKHE